MVQNTVAVIVEFIELFLKKGFKMLVHAVKEDLRRDENKVGFGMEEMEFFTIVTSCLKYQRLKILDDKEQYLLRVQQSCAGLNENSSNGWIPDLRSIMAALDKMSFRRVLASLHRLHSVEKKYDKLLIPMETYKEMICYIYVMLQSSDVAHHELAIAALYPLFYANSQDKLDPLTHLLRDWKLGVYSRKHAHILVELVHETLKVLEAAKACFKNNDSRKPSKGREEEEMSRYVNAALRFDEIEYFERLVTNHTVKFYTTLLNDHANSTSQVNHYIYCFLQDSGLL